MNLGKIKFMNNKERYAKWISDVKPEDRRPDCHPFRRYYAKGLCNKCYDAQRHHKRYSNPERRIAEIEKATRWYLANKDRVHARRFGMVKEQYEALLAKQNGACAICGGQPKDARRRGYFCIDHDRSCCKGNRACGKCVRGLLCITCNAGLGQFNDKPELLDRAASYLRGG